MRARLATTADIPELVRLRQVMLESVRGHTDTSWQDSCAALLAQMLGDGSIAAVVVDQPDGAGLAACGIGLVSQRLPSPGCPDGRFGYIQSMCTDEHHRRQGLGRVVFDGLMAWYRDAGVTRVDLHASRMGAPLYRSFGFVEGTEPELRWRAAD